MKNTKREPQPENGNINNGNPSTELILERKKRGNRIRLVIELILTALFVIGAFFYVHNSISWVGVTLELLVKTDTPENEKARLFINKKVVQTLQLKNTSDFQTVGFKLPKNKINHLRLSVGQQSKTIVVKRLVIKNLLNQSTLEGNHLTLISQNKYGVKKDYVENNLYFLEIKESEYWIEPGMMLYQIINRQQKNKTFYYFLGIILALLVFYILHYLSFSLLRKLLKPKLLVNGGMIFVLLISIPFMDQQFGIFSKFHLVEKRKLARKPDFRLDDLSDYPTSYREYYNDHFKYRGFLIFYYNLLKVKLFNVSPTPRVLVGKENWLFLDQSDLRPGTVEYYRSIKLFTPEELRSWRDTYEQRYQWLSKRGIRYLLVIVPNKNTIYPEYMPDRIRRVHQESRMDQLLAYLKTNSHVPYLDLRPALREAKKKNLVYSKTDTHWSDFGAYVAYSEIMKYISRYFQNAKPYTLDRFKIESINHMGGDLAIMLSLHEEVMRDIKVILTSKQPSPAQSVALPKISRFVRQSETICKDATLPNILMVHDSFYHRLRPFLSAHFSNVLYIWDWNFNFYPKIINRKKPKLVIDEMAERFLMGENPSNPASIKAIGQIDQSNEKNIIK